MAALGWVATVRPPLSDTVLFQVGPSVRYQGDERLWTVVMESGDKSVAPMPNKLVEVCASCGSMVSGPELWNWLAAIPVLFLTSFVAYGASIPWGGSNPADAGPALQARNRCETTHAFGGNGAFIACGLVYDQTISADLSKEAAEQDATVARKKAPNS